MGTDWILVILSTHKLLTASLWRKKWCCKDQLFLHIYDSILWLILHREQENCSLYMFISNKDQGLLYLSLHKACFSQIASHTFYLHHNYFFVLVLCCLEDCLLCVQSTLDFSKLWGLFFTCSNYAKCKLICTSDNLDL